MIYSFITAFSRLIDARMKRAKFLKQLAFVAKRNMDEWRFIVNLIDTGKYARFHTP